MSALIGVGCSEQGSRADRGGPGAGNGNGTGSGGLSQNGSDEDGGGSDIIIDDDVDRPPADYCDEFQVNFEPQTPTVYIVVDRSSSMFEQTNYWGNLRDGLLPVIQELQGDVRFGFASYTGVKDDYPTCGLDEGVPIADNNYAAIEAAWGALGDQLTGPLMAKGETPTSFAVQQAAALLLADPSPGARFILLVSDGSPDMCGDDYNLCGVDGTIAALQIAARQGIRTLVFGIETETVTQDEFDKFAQAGIGEAPVAPIIDGNSMDTYDDFYGPAAGQCADKGIWPDLKAQNAAFREEVGMAPSAWQPAAAYSSTPGTATAFLSTDLGALAAQIQASLDGLKSCTIEFNFDVLDDSAGDIFVHDMETPIHPDQWRMNESHVLELLGDACALWQTADVTEFFAGFPCRAVVVR